MGYSTDFDGSLKLSKNLTDEQKEYINTLSGTRRMRRDVNKLMTIYGGKHGYPGVPITAKPEEIYGHEGEFFAYDDGDSGQRGDYSVLDHNMAPGQKGFMGETTAQPGLWCQWVITSSNVRNTDGTVTNVEQNLEWDGGEKFYNYVEWLKYLIDKFFNRWGVLLNGEITWEGEDSDDIGKIVVVDNVVKIKHGYKAYR